MKTSDVTDPGRQAAYAAQAKAAWGSTPEYRAYEERAGNRGAEENAALGREMMGIFAALGSVRGDDPAGEAAQGLVRKLQGFISAHFYPCPDQMLSSLGALYAADGEFTQSIDRAGGPGTAAFVSRAIQFYCKR